MQSAPSTQRLIQGLRPGHVYQVTLKVFEFYTVVCTDTENTMTVPATSQITFSKAVSSTSIRFEWSSVIGADSYNLFVEELFSFPAKKYNWTFTTLGGQVDGLTPSTTYNCYVYSSNNAGRGSRMVQPPTGVSLVPTGKSTARVTWNPVSKVLLYQVSVKDNDNLSNPPVIRNTSTTSMDISNLEPCSTYTVGVSSVNIFLVPGEPSNVTHTTSTINPVTTISVDYSCSSGMVTVTWDLVFGANLYRATAVDGTGAALNCTSASTSCQITRLNCGEKYRVHVTAISDDCESTSNASSLFETVPCAPANPQTIHDCSSNAIVFSWQPTNNTFYYVATAVDDTGKVTECRTPDNMCFFTNTGCGQFYKYSVYAVSSECNSEVTQPEFVRTSPCLPTNIKTAAECHSDMLITTWDSAAGALSYTVEAQGNTGETYNCTSSSNSCAVTGVPCGEHLSVWIVASNDNCSTDKVLGEVAQTVPCTPTNVSASVDCSQDSARVNWTTSIGAIFYIAVAQDTAGNSYSCSSMGTNCLMEDLKCGQNYTANVIATNLKCNSTDSMEVTFMTAPCPPTHIEAFRDCDANHALIVWQNHQPTGLYTATIEDQSGVQLTCTSNTVNNCKITSLPCGRRYSVTVTYNDGNCPSTSTPISMDSVPCGPEDVQTSVACVTGELTVTWNISVPAENYTTIISGGMGQPLHCNSTETQCTTAGLTCGSSYTVTVFSVTGTCFSLPSSEVTVQTLPCPPTNVTAVHTCHPDPVPVSWVASDSAKYYSAVAVSSSGHKSECMTNKTSCSFSGLLCGEVYTIGVAGADDNCTGQQGDTVSLYTEPCVPSNVSSQLSCVAGTAQLSWAPSPNAVSYAVKATSSGQTLTCNSPSPNCTLSDLVCDSMYDIVVTATDGTCVSSYSTPFRQDPVPCAPVNVNTNLLCGTNELMVSWSLASVPFNYSVTAVPLTADVNSVTCHTDSANCTLSGLQCGQTYNVSVKASSGNCSGAYSIPQTVQTAPCSPQSLTAVTNCGTNSILASWNASLGATSYRATVTGPDSFSETCSSSNLTCPFSGLQCASQYTVTVTSQNSQCTSSPSQMVMTTGPCDPVNVTSVLQCGTDTATVSWDAAAGAFAYTVLAQEHNSQHHSSCRSKTTSCQLNYLHCGKAYNLTVLAEDATCNSTRGTRAVLMTAPCSPSIQSSNLICGTNSSSLSWMPVADATDLLCGETYTATITARGSQCDSAPGSSTNITTAIISKQYTCGTNTALFSWTDPVGRLGFLAQVAGEGYLDSCQTTNTSCAFHNLPCGLDFNITVQAQGAQCNSTQSVSESFESVPCAPENVSATLVCFSHSALVSWAGSPSAVGYNVTATGQDGHTHHYHTNTTSFQVPDIHCGETYSIAVTPYSESCVGTQSAAYSFRAGLCPPSDVIVSPACKDSTVSWSHVTGAEMYIATATADDGHNHTCSSNYSSSCNFTDLHCGETYAVTVVTVDRGCRSEPSSAVELRTALCPPTNLTGQVSCDTSTLTLTWDHSPVPGATYTLHTERIGSTLPPSVHTTANTSHTLTNLLCGQRYAFRIAALDGTCRSSYSPPIEISTAPCQPTNFTARMDCGTNKGNFSWAESSGADFYTVEVTGEHGHVASCSSNDTSCAVKLHCGRSYSATLVASTESCNSTKHTDIQFDSAPCLPDDVVAELKCNTNVMTVSWTQTPGSDNYTAWAISTDGHRASCNSTSNSCSIYDLRCGQVYEVAVTSSSIHCKIIAGSDYKVQSAPCKPENTTVEQNCSSNIMTVKWSQSSTTQNYTVKATSASGVNSSCDSTESSCSFLNLSCGQLYSFTVMGHTNVCMSEMSTPMEKHTAPCPPTNVSTEMNCTTRKALVSWNTAAAATAYSVQATSINGYNSSCSGMGTSCNLNNLVCGQEYSVVVEAMNTGCPGPASAPARLTTEPCVPTNLSVHYNVSAAQVLWDAASGARSYSVQAVTEQGLTVTCNTTNTSCFLNGLQCSQIYNVTVTAHNLACDSLMSETKHLMTEPCPPTNIQANMVCEQLTATASWDQSDLAVGYVAYFDDQNGHLTSCVGTDADTSCVVSGLMCGTVYNMWVKALGQRYNSSDSTVTSLTSGPCQPNGIEAVMDCETRSSTVSWQPSVGAVSYVSELTALSGHTASCTANYTNCQLTSLQCGEEYNVTVKAVGETCNSTGQMAGYFTTEPCAPMNLSVNYNVGSAQVLWGATKGAKSYSVQAVTDQGLTVTCNTTNNTHCSLTGLQCSQIYNVTVAAYNLACNNSVTSETYHVMTEPCPPTNIQANVACEQLTSTVSWEQSDLAVGYVAYFDNQNGHLTSCSGTDTETSCVVSGLMCGTVYNVWVKALGQRYNSSDSTVISLTSAPCLPTEVEVEVDCNSEGAAVVSWNATYGAANFSLTAIVSGSLQTLCTTQQNSCNVTDLNCGETYNLSLTASNKQCSLTAPTHANLTTRPCPPQRVAVDLQCGSRTAVLSWEERSDVELYKAGAVKASGGEVQMCNSTGSTCQFPGLTCGEMYNFTVAAHTEGCCSKASHTVFIQTEPCQPVIVSAQAFCHSEEVQISWHRASGVVNYLITATGSLGYVESYNTTQMLLSAALPCGQNYSVTVQGQGSECDSIPSSPAFLKTTPCVPRDVTTYVQCEFNMGSVSWGPSDGAETYVAVATGLDGHTHQCLTNTTSCTWEDLHCGEEYTVVVRAKVDNCTSLPSNSSVIHMDPCVPRNLVTSVNCDMKFVSLSWDASNGTNLYMVSAEGGYGSIGLTTNVTTAYFSEFICGQNYSLTVTPHNQHCPGHPSAPASIQTWPCPPAGVSTMQDCLSSIVMVTWQPSNGTDYYTATMQTDSGISNVCMSDSDKCSVPGLNCGHNFSVSVTASNQQCNVTSSLTTSLQSVPCVPTNVSAVMDCANNTAVVSWSASLGAVQYSVTAYSSHSNASCQTSDLTCNLDNLTCGSRYTVQVVAMDDNCSSIPSQALVFSSAACPPQNLSSQVNCLSNDVTISWDATREAEYFLVSVTPENGGSSESCNTTNTACSVSNLTCGNTFTVEVTSVRGDCRSQHSQTHIIMAAPCQPQGIRGNLDCVTNSAWISWDAAPGADSYTVSAVGGEDYTANCTTSTNTTCEVEGLACGVLYNFSVVAKNSECESQPSATIELQTAPCSLSGITAFPQCHNSSILVVWDLMEGREGNTVYTATAEASDHTYLSCNNTGTSCSLHGARCDLHYTIIVAASSDQCSSLRSPPYRISMEPCPPRDVMVNASCEDHSALVSWTSSPVAETYHVVAMGADGHVHTCNTTSSNCSLSELHCDQQYTVFVTASHENCSSKASQNATLNTGPCQPDGISVTFHCNNQSALLSWMRRDNAVDYYGCAQAENGDMLYCHSTNPTCIIEGLDCGTVYNFSVQASDGTCNSSFSDPLQSGAAPCPPDAIQVQLMPMQTEIQVMHFSWTQITCRDTEYILKLTGSLLGDSQAQFDLSSYWTNRTYFEIPLPCGSSYVATVESRNAAGTSDPSVPLNKTTAPCPPSGVVYSGNRSFATVSWNASVFATTYTVYDNRVSPEAQLCSTAGLSCSLSNITTTNLVITASNAAGESEAKSITNVITQGRRRRDLSEKMPDNGGFSAPVLDVTQAMSTVIFVEWSQVDTASHYSLIIRPQGSSHEPQELTVFGESIILTDLSPSSTYCFSVSARNATTRGPESEPVCVQTGQGLPQ
ncbi:mucin-4-like [Thunnus thynnus]|uniref:mucin-4-like n=1 Tax=Thunnus thynnus TaxID=8237 RepID=UPI0035293EDC